ncbi:phosphoribosylanthranilate isomerase [Sphingomonas sp. ERG5]|uniref:phosphoribosylanthranilate isomerase n=1 Tax=Sphingomonas sp. ERG5 TaxID=1381597 RepID=UPI002E15717D
MGSDECEMPFFMRTRVKICCIRSDAEARMAIAAGADAVGFVAQRPPSPRTIADDQIAGIIAVVPPPIATFLLTSESSADAISAHIELTRPTTVQILPHLTQRESARLAELQPHVRRVQVIHVEGREALALIPAYAPYVHAFLLDSGSPNAAIPRFGGTGLQHDWAISADFVKASPLPVFLAGGLSAANAADAIRRVRPFGLDLCTGIRTEGLLDETKLASFMLAVRKADEAFQSD